MCQKVRKERITKKEFYDRGGFANSALFRQQSRGGAWRYYVSLDYVAAGTVTGRWPSQMPEMQPSRFHRFGETPLPVVEVDYSAIEARMLAASDVVIDPLQTKTERQPSADIYDAMRLAMEGVKEITGIRGIGKNPALGAPYGCTCGGITGDVAQWCPACLERYRK